MRSRLEAPRSAWQRPLTEQWQAVTPSREAQTPKSEYRIDDAVTTWHDPGRPEATPSPRLHGATQAAAAGTGTVTMTGHDDEVRRRLACRT